MKECEAIEKLRAYCKCQILQVKGNYEGDSYAPDGTFILDVWICPCCENRYEVDYDDYDYCPNCGQKIDWSDKK